MSQDLIVIDQQQITTTTQPLDQNPAAVFIASKPSDHSKRTMRNGLDKMAGLMSAGKFDALSFQWENLRYKHTNALRAGLINKFKPATVNNMLSALRGVLKEAWRLGLLTADEYQNAVDIQNIKNETLPAGREITQGEILALLQCCNTDVDKQGNITPLGARDAALIAVLYTAGLRRAEAVKLSLTDYDPTTGKLHIHGKGRKERTSYLPESARFYLDRWLALRGKQPGAVFCPLRRGGHIENKYMTSQTVYDGLKARAKTAGVKDFSPHDFRRTLVGDLLDRGVDINTVSKIVGHSQIGTTARYDRRPENAKMKASELITVPLPGKMM